MLGGCVWVAVKSIDRNVSLLCLLCDEGLLRFLPSKGDSRKLSIIKHVKGVVW